MPDKKQAVQEEVDCDCLFGNCLFRDHQRNGAPVYSERKLSIRWDPSSAACSGSAPPSWQAKNQALGTCIDYKSVNAL
jgi:hypothetical protein